MHPRSLIERARRIAAAIGEDVDSAIERDPALQGRIDAVLNSPGLHAVWAHRVAHAMWDAGAPLRIPARVVSTVARSVTGVEIHPAAQIGRRLFIDHGMGVVIGETAVIGDDVLLYHGATLGGRTQSTGQRHPTLGDRVLVGAGARILGPVTVGSDAKVGANSVVLRDVPAGMTAVGAPATTIVPRPRAVPDPPPDEAVR